MGLILVPSEIISKSTSVKTALSNIATGYQNVLTQVNNFANDEALQSDSWTKLKEKVLEYHTFIEQGMLVVQESVETDLATLEGSIGSETLDEDELVGIIEELENEKKNCEEAIEKWNIQKNSMAIYVVNSSLSSMIERSIEILEKEIENLNELINTYKEKLEFLYMAEDSTKSLLDSAIQLLTAMSALISEVGVKIMSANPEATLPGIDCETYKSIIEEKLKEKGQESLYEWLPPVMQINGVTEQEKRLKTRLDTINDDEGNLKWDQEKVNKVWEACSEYYEKTGVQVDPRLMLAIVICEGNGSFNTSNKNLAADGQNGMNVNFDEDVRLAVDLVGGKVVAYAYYQEAFSAAREDAYGDGLKGIKDYDDILHYINWTTPRVSLESNEMITGNYAGNNSWNSDVRQVYSEFAYDQVSKKYGEYALSLGKNKFIEVTEKYDISIDKVEFKPIKNGQDKNGDDNDEYTIIGEEQ